MFADLSPVPYLNFPLCSNGLKQHDSKTLAISLKFLCCLYKLGCTMTLADTTYAAILILSTCKVLPRKLYAECCTM